MNCASGQGGDRLTNLPGIRVSFLGPIKSCRESYVCQGAGASPFVHIYIYTYVYVYIIYTYIHIHTYNRVQGSGALGLKRGAHQGPREGPTRAQGRGPLGPSGFFLGLFRISQGSFGTSLRAKGLRNPKRAPKISSREVKV